MSFGQKRNAKKDTEGKMKHHVPEMVWSHKLEEIHGEHQNGRLRDAEWGRCVLYIIASRKLDPITKLKGKKFFRARSATFRFVLFCPFPFVLKSGNIQHCSATADIESTLVRNTRTSCVVIFWTY
jgi:hypothetical protein